MRIAIDIMGGDHAPAAVLDGVGAAMGDFPGVEQFLLVGDSEVIQREAPKHGLSLADARLEIVHASQVVTMGEPSAVALRAKKDSSITVTARLLKEGRADAIISAGHTGAAVASMVVMSRTLAGIERPGIATVFPAPHGSFVVLDVGANVECKPLHLAQYAILGEAYSRDVLNVAAPRVGLLSVGAEDSKGNELTKEAHKMLRQLPINFVGNVEGNQLFSDNVDVVVCDGFVGNVVLKSCESLAKALSGILRDRLGKTPVRKAGAFLSKNAFRELKQLTDYEEYGGAPLLGLNGICIIAHGSSSPKAIRNAVRVAREMVKQGMNTHISEKLSQIDWKALSAPAGEH